MTGLDPLLAPGLAGALALLALVVVRVVRARNRAERAIVFERELSGDLLEQAAGFDRLVVALAGIADDLDESHVLARTATEASRLVEADAGLVLERDGGRLVVTAACVPDGTPAPRAVEATDL